MNLQMSLPCLDRIQIGRFSSRKKVNRNGENTQEERVARINKGKQHDWQIMMLNQKRGACCLITVTQLVVSHLGDIISL
jgi:hypothetical protein